MCGIVGYVSRNKRTLRELIKGLYNLEYRGYDSSGMAYVTKNKILIKKAVGKISELEQVINLDDETNTLIGHTRWATHGKPTRINAHPHKCGKITIVHNGIIENYIELKNMLLDLGYDFVSETDTEVASGLLDYYYNKTNDMLKAIKLFKEKVIGSYAISLICEDELESLYVIRKNSPLIIGVMEDGYYVASSVLAIIPYTKKYITLENDAYSKITNNNIFIYHDDVLVEQHVDLVESDMDATDKNGYKHYMLKEIYEEPDIIRNNINNYKIPDISKYKKIVIVGCGSAMHAGLVGKSLLEKYGNIETYVEIASEFRYKKLFLDSETLVILISQSGETADTLEAARIAKKCGSFTLGIINVLESSIAREADQVIYTNAGSEIAVATTKAYMAQVLVLSLLTYKVAKIKGNDINLNSFLDDIKKIPVIMEQILANNQYKEIAKKLVKSNDIFYIGRNIDYAISMEGSLKLKEIAYIHSEAYAAGELKHGTISLIEDNLPVVGVVSDASIALKTISNLEEVKSRGAYVIYITTSSLDREGNFYDVKVVLPTVNELLQPLINIIPLQLIAYYTAKLKGCDIDKPKNLAKSVTVE